MKRLEDVQSHDEAHRQEITTIRAEVERLETENAALRELAQDAIRWCDGIHAEACAAFDHPLDETGCCCERGRIVAQARELGVTSDAAAERAGRQP